MTRLTEARRKKITWVKMGPAPALATCARCGIAEVQPDLPMPLAAFLTYLDYVLIKHEDCEESE